MELQDQIKEYQQKYGSGLKYYTGWGLLPDWELKLLIDLKAIKIKYKTLRISSPQTYQNFQETKENWQNSGIYQKTRHQIAP